MNLLEDLEILFRRNHVVRIPISVNLTGVSFRVDEARPESRLVRLVVCVVIWVSQRASFSSVPSGSRIQGVVLLRNVHSVEPSGRHCLRSAIQVFGSHDVSGLLGYSLLKVRVGSKAGNVTLIAWDDHVLSASLSSLFRHIVI